MYIFIIYFIILCFLFAVMSLVFFETKIIFMYDGKFIHLKVSNGILKLKLKIPEKKTKKNKKNLRADNLEANNPEKQINRYKEIYKENKKMLLDFFRLTRYKIKISGLSLKLGYGCGNAVSTGILYGVLWGLVSAVHGVLNLYFNSEYPKFEITPDFQNVRFEISAEGIIKVRLVHIINAVVKIIWLNIKNINIKERGK